jgi:hypothetical protein
LYNCIPTQQTWLQSPYDIRTAMYTVNGCKNMYVKIHTYSNKTASSDSIGSSIPWSNSEIEHTNLESDKNRTLSRCPRWTWWVGRSLLIESPENRTKTIESGTDRQIWCRCRDLAVKDPSTMLFTSMTADSVSGIWVKTSLAKHWNCGLN